MLLQKLRKAAREFKINQIALAGGVSANSVLRKALEDMARKEGWRTYIPAFEYCTDNAGMIAMAAHFKYMNKEFVGQEVSAMPRMKI